jgi:hypothetical protein
LARSRKPLGVVPHRRDSIFHHDFRGHASHWSCSRSTKRRQAQATRPGADHARRSARMAWTSRPVGSRSRLCGQGRRRGGPRAAASTARCFPQPCDTTGALGRPRDCRSTAAGDDAMTFLHERLGGGRSSRTPSSATCPCMRMARAAPLGYLDPPGRCELRLGRRRSRGTRFVPSSLYLLAPLRMTAACP